MKKLKLKKIIITIGVVFILLVVIFLFFTKCKVGLFENNNQYYKEEAETLVVYNNEEYVLNNNIVSVLMLGLQQQTIPNDNIGPQADTLILASIDIETNKVSLAAISRDLYTEIYYLDASDNIAFSLEAPICNVYAQAGNPDNMLNSINAGKLTSLALSKELLNIPITRFAAVDIKAVGEVVDVLGGIELPITEEFANMVQTPVAPTVKMNGETAEFYLRYRSQSEIENTNEARMARQKEFLRILLDDLIFRCTEKPLLTLDIYSIIIDDVTTDLSFREIVYLSNIGLKLDIENIELTSLEGESIEQEFILNEEAMMEYVLKTFYIKS